MCCMALDHCVFAINNKVYFAKNVFLLSEPSEVATSRAKLIAIVFRRSQIDRAYNTTGIHVQQDSYQLSCLHNVQHRLRDFAGKLDGIFQGGSDMTSSKF